MLVTRQLPVAGPGLLQVSLAGRQDLERSIRKLLDVDGRRRRGLLDLQPHLVHDVVPVHPHGQDVKYAEMFYLVAALSEALLGSSRRR